MEGLHKGIPITRAPQSQTQKENKGTYILLGLEHKLTETVKTRHFYALELKQVG